MNAGRSGPNNVVRAGKAKFHSPSRISTSSNGKIILSSLSTILGEFCNGFVNEKKRAKRELVDSFGERGAKVFTDWILSLGQYNWSQIKKELWAMSTENNPVEEFHQIVLAKIEFEEKASPQNSGNRATGIPEVPDYLDFETVKINRARKEEISRRKVVVRDDVMLFIKCLEQFFVDLSGDFETENCAAARNLFNFVDEIANALVSGGVKRVSMPNPVDDGRTFVFCLGATGDYSAEKSIRVSFCGECGCYNFSPNLPLYRGPGDAESFFSEDNFYRFSYDGIRKQNAVKNGCTCNCSQNCISKL